MIILDNGHGIETPGKRSPIWRDGTQLFEFEFNRDIVRRIYAALKALNIPAHILVPETKDIALSVRIDRANAIHALNPRAIVLSIHGNAGGGTGWEAWTSPELTLSDRIADLLYIEAMIRLKNFPVRMDKSDGDMDKESKFAILVDTHCPAVLTENLFMDTEKDCRFMMSDEGRDIISGIHVAAIKKWLQI